MGYIPVFASEITDITRNNAINVESLSAFGTPVGRTTTLVTGTTYIITKDFDWEDRLFIIPNGGDIGIETSSSVSNGITTSISGSDVLFSGQINRFFLVDLDITSSGGQCFDLTGAPGLFPTLQITRGTLIGFDAIGTVDSAAITLRSVGYFFNGAGWAFNDVGAINLQTQIFAFHTGDHITATGTTNTVIATDVAGVPLTGDQIFNFDALTVLESTHISETLFNPVNGGDTGLVKVLTSDTLLDNIFTDIRVDTTGGTVALELPDTDSMEMPTGYDIFVTDLGSAGTNNITIIQNSSSLLPIDLKPSFVMDVDDQAIIITKVNGQWVITGNSADYIVIGLMAMISNATVTTINTAGVYEDIAGTIVGSAGNQRFDFATDTLTYTGVRDIESAIDISIFLKRETAAASRVMKFGLFVNDVLQQEVEVTMTSDITNASFATVLSLVTGDDIKMKVQNTQDTANVIITTYDFRALRVSNK